MSTFISLKELPDYDDTDKVLYTSVYKKREKTQKMHCVHCVKEAEPYRQMIQLSKSKFNEMFDRLDNRLFENVKDCISDNFNDMLISVAHPEKLVYVPKNMTSITATLSKASSTNCENPKKIKRPESIICVEVEPPACANFNQMIVTKPIETGLLTAISKGVKLRGFLKMISTMKRDTSYTRSSINWTIANIP